MSNRDCEHGRQTGKCVECDYANLRQAVAEFSHEVEGHTDDNPVRMKRSAWMKYRKMLIVADV